MDTPKKTQDATERKDWRIERFLIPGKASAQDILDLFEKITGRKGSPEEIEELRREMKKRESNA